MSSPASSEMLVVTIVMATGMVASAIDLNSRRVPNPLTAMVALTGVLLAVTGMGRVGVIGALAGCGVGLLLMLPGHVFGATGGGDVKLLAAFGTLLGPWDIVTAFLITAIAGGVLAVGTAVHRGRVRQTLGATVRIAAGGQAALAEIEADRTFAYAPAIAIGAALAAIGV